MPRAAGESDKLGNRYEGVWTIGKLLDVACGNAASVTVEPIDDHEGIEFVLCHSEHRIEYHSAKRQRAKGDWSLSALSTPSKPKKRSILCELFAKLTIGENVHCSFVSSTGANDLRELTERARRRITSADFHEELSESTLLFGKYEKYLLRHLSLTRETAFHHLKRIHAVLIDEATLMRQVDQHLRFSVYRPDSRVFTELEVRLLLGDFILDNLGNELHRDAIWSYLKRFGYLSRNWLADNSIRDLIAKANAEYVRSIEFDLINESRIQRTEVRKIVEEAVRVGGSKTILVSAPAGFGKSCIMAQVTENLRSRGVHLFAVRLDRHGDAHSPVELGTVSGLPGSPCIALAGIADGGHCVLVIDQLDSASQISGRYPHLWEVFESLYEELTNYPNMRAIIACREFDLQHDRRLRKLHGNESQLLVQVSLLTVEDVSVAVATATMKPSSLNGNQTELLRVPLHLLLYLEGLATKGTSTSFETIGELFDSYWDCKQRKVSERIGRASDWAAVIGRACDLMSRNLRTYVLKASLDDWPETVSAMLTEHVLIAEDGQIRMFHESFFDYAFARRFCMVTSIEKGARAGVEKGATWVLKNAPEWGGNARCSFLRWGL